MKKFLLFLISLLTGIGLFVWIIKFVGWQEIKTAFSAFVNWKGLIILGLTLLTALVAAWKWKEILRAGGTNISFSDIFRYHLGAFFITYLFPTIFLGGEVLQSYILKKKHFLPWAKGMAAAIIDQILDWTTNLVIIFLGIIFFLLNIGFLPPKMTIFFLLLFSVCSLAIFFFYFIVFKKKSVVRVFFKFLNRKEKNNAPLKAEEEIFEFFKFKKIHFWKAIFLAFLEEALLLFRVFILIVFFGKHISFLSTLSILGFSYLAMMIPIPAVLGIHEGIQAFAFNAFGLGAGTGTAFTMVIRGVDLIIAFFGLFIFLKLGSELFKPLFKNGQNFK